MFKIGINPKCKCGFWETCAAVRRIFWEVIKVKNNYDQELLEILLKKTSVDYIKEESRKIDELADTAYKTEFSDKFNKDTHKLIKKMKMHDKFAAIPKYAACLAAFLLVVTLANPKTAVAYKNKFTNFFREETDSYIMTTSFSANVEYPMEDFPKTWEALYAPAKVPSGYTVKSVRIVNDIYYHITFAKGDIKDNDEIDFICYNTTGVYFVVDNEKPVSKVVDINGYDGLLTVWDYGKIHLTWHTEDNAFVINTESASEDEIMKIAQSVEKMN